MNFAKIALFLLYYRLFASHRRTKIAIYLGIVMNCLVYGTFAIPYCVLCIARLNRGWCGRYAAREGYFQGAFNLASDLYTFLLPLPVLSSLHMPLGRKLGVAATFGTGLM